MQRMQHKLYTVTTDRQTSLPFTRSTGVHYISLHNETTTHNYICIFQTAHAATEESCGFEHPTFSPGTLTGYCTKLEKKFGVSSPSPGGIISCCSQSTEMTELFTLPKCTDCYVKFQKKIRIPRRYTLYTPILKSVALSLVFAAICRPQNRNICNLEQ